MYGLKRLEFNEHGRVIAIEFNEDTSEANIRKALEELCLIEKPVDKNPIIEPKEGAKAFIDVSLH